MSKITLKFRDIFAKMGKTAVEVSAETGLNRNTINSLFNGKVDGVKFSTIEKICSAYGLSVDDLIAIESGQEKVSNTTKSKDLGFGDIYKQEGEIFPFTAWTWMVLSNRSLEPYFDYNLGKLACYYKEKYGEVFWDKNLLSKLANNAFEKYSDHKKLNELFDHYLYQSKRVEEMYLAHSEDFVVGLSEVELVNFYKELWNSYERFWFPSLFIDSFDSGTDQEIIRLLSKRYKLSSEEVVVLTTPSNMTFGDERKYALLKIAKELINKGVDKKDKIKKYVESSNDVEEYIRNFDYYKSNYAKIEHISIEEVVDELYTYIKKQDQFKKEYEELLNYEKDHDKEKEDILKSKKLKDNPLYFFEILTYWREHRKKINLMGIHLLHYIMSSVESKTGIPKKYVAYMGHEELESVLRGFVGYEILKDRYENGVLVSIDGEKIRLYTDNEASSLHEQLDEKINKSTDSETINGQVASQGFAKGIAKVVLDTSEFDKFEEGDILVTGMTRPEFVPLMKKAAGIVTNEGGITCHAAIVSRELGKPCIIGTQNATKVIKDGDMVEVRSHHGTVRIIRN